MTKMLIMGLGYVGMALINTLQNHEIYLTTTKKEKIESLKLYAKHVYLLTPTLDLTEMFDACDAAIILVASKNQANYAETYLNTAKRISFALRSRKTPFHLTYTSSTSVYEGHDGWVSEATLLCPSSDKAKILIEAEKHFLDCTNACILRLGGIYGPNRDLLQRAIRMSGQKMVGNGLEPTNHIHLDDIVSGIHFAFQHHLKGIYNLVNDDHPCRKQLYTTLCESLNLPSPKWEFQTSQKNRYQVSNQKIKNVGFTLQHPYLQ